MKLLRRPILDQVATQRTPLLITKRGKPVARLVPGDDAPVTLSGRMAGTIRIVGNIVSSPLDESEWGNADAENVYGDGKTG